ncbi:mRNA capping enzyme domain-containing protein [Ditylenchus destructor]|uniref:mRNA (guanine-N(7))-methyltransferase n=2 Tax=Ditylenchus destructor TaxID=166010 RepID=A0AAD4QTG7_9BILA|nr:mRNA capping enzyme domain-containing protein [Ditylenchus destructor]
MSSSSVAREHYNAVPNKGVQERTNSRIFYLRNFNNWMKSMLIADFIERLRDEGSSSATVLDLCCGKGGDLLKWKIGNISSIVMTDVAEIALNHCRDRYTEMRDRFARDRQQPFEAHFIAADATQDSLREKYPDTTMHFDLVSCQFALHYSFSSEESAQKILWNAADALRPGGYFIGAIPDASMIMQFLHKNNGHFQNEVCKISYVDKSENFAEHQPPLFGAQLNFELDEVVNCPEYLAYFPLLVRILEEFGMELVYYYNFPDAINYYLKKNEKNALDLMKRIRALETFPALPNSNLIAVDPSEYEHAEEKLREKNIDDPTQKMGTLSKNKANL